MEMERPKVTPMQIVRMAEVELATLKPWLAIDPKSPHIRETGHRLAELARMLIEQGGGS